MRTKYKHFEVGPSLKNNTQPQGKFPGSCENHVEVENCVLFVRRSKKYVA